MVSTRLAFSLSLLLAVGAGSATPAEVGFDTASVGGGQAADIAARLGRPPRFLIGMGNDLANDHNQDGAYTLGVTLDLHYAYLVGLQGQGGWPDWNAGGTFVNVLADSANAHGVVPMFTLYQTAAWGEANLAVLTNDGFMAPYWSGVRLLFQRLAVFGKPAVVHLEPDFWGFAQAQNSNPAAIPVRVRAHAPECADLPDDLTGMGRCMLRMARSIAPSAIVGFHASPWAGSTAATAAYLNAVGASEADIVVIETLDRDAGCFEAGVDPNCQRGGGPWYWDASNTTSPNFREHLQWARAIHDGIGRPLLWWQMPFGVPSSQPGGTAGHYRDNRVQYLFAHTDEFVAAGGVGAVFGTGAGNQTYITTDGGQFRNAVTAYLASPVPLPRPDHPRLSIDLSGEGRDDVLWREQGGALYAWMMNGAGVGPGSGPLPSTDPSWRVEELGDFNGDGKGDVLWRHTATGATYVWLMNGSSVAGQGLTVAQAGKTWQVVGVGDFDGGGTTDILWQHASGALYLWRMAGTSLAGSGALPSAAPGWLIRGIGDVDGDGRTDVVWRHVVSGATYVWLMSGTSVIGQGFTTGRADPAWQLQGIGDLDGDARSDLVWRHTSGAAYVWLMNGTSLKAGSGPLPTIALSWGIKGLGDLDGNGRGDLLWREASSGASYVWFMNGTQVVSQGFTTSQAGPNWTMQPAAP